MITLNESELQDINCGNDNMPVASWGDPSLQPAIDPFLWTLICQLLGDPGNAVMNQHQAD